MSLSRFFLYNLNISDGSIVASHNSNTIGSLITTAGNIGIGTTAPSFNLDVIGTARISNNLIVPTGNIISRPTGQNGSIRYNTETQQFEGYGPGGAWGSLGGVVDIAQTTKILASETPSTTDGNLYFFTTGTERMRINSSGNIGIGTTAPSFLLDVNGNSRFINSVVTNSTITNLTLVNSSISSLSLSNAIDLSNVTQFSGSFAAANNVITPTDVTGFQLSNSVYGCFTSTLNVRVTTSTGQLNSQVYMEATQNTSGWLLNDSTLGDSTGITFTLNSSGQLQYTSTNQPNWISTTFTYLVNAIKLSSGLTQSIQTSGNAIISGNLTILNTTDIGGSSTPSLAISGGLSVDKRSFFNNNVGIGTTNPTFNLDVSGTGRFTTGITTGSLEVIGLSDTLNLTATNISSGTLVATGNSNTIGNIVTTGGNVGIGTIVPSQSLHVNGNILTNKIYYTDQPHFCVTNPTGGNINALGDVTFNTVVYQSNTPCWNTSSNLFTAPIAGLYQFDCTFLVNYDVSTNEFIIALRRSNNATEYRIFQNGNPVGDKGQDTASGSILLKLSANETVKMQWLFGTVRPTSIAASENYSWFTGRLVG